MHLSKPNYEFYFWGSSSLFLVAGAWSIYNHTLLPIWVLLGLTACVLVALQPKNLFWLLIASIPFSVEHQTNWGFSTDFPDEFFMLGLTFLCPFLFMFPFSVKLKKALSHPISLLLVFQFLWSFCTLFYSTHPILSIKYIASKIWYAAPFVYLVQLTLVDLRDAKRLALAILLPTTLVALYALYYHYHTDFTFITINDAVSPFFRNHVNYAATLSFGFAIALILFWHTPSKALKLWLGAALFILLLAIFFSYTRGTWLSVVLGIVSLALFVKRKIYLTFLLTSCVVLGSFLTLSINDNYLILKPDFEKTIVHSSLSDHLSSMYNLHEISGSERLHRWVAGVRMIADRPFQGFGPACFYNEYKPFTDSRFKTWVSNNPEKSSVHNYFLLMWIEQGVVGFMLFIILLFYFFHRCHVIYFTTKSKVLKICIEILVMVMCNILVVNFFSDMIETDKVGTIFFLCLGVLIWAETEAERHRVEFDSVNLTKSFAEDDSLV